MPIHGRPLDPQELVGHIDAVDEDAVVRVAKRIIAGKPTVAALGPVGKLEKLELFAERLRSNRTLGSEGVALDLLKTAAAVRDSAAALSSLGTPRRAARARSPRLARLGRVASRLARFSDAVGAELGRGCAVARRVPPPSRALCARMAQRPRLHVPALPSRRRCAARRDQPHQCSPRRRRKRQRRLLGWRDGTHAKAI